ncbi:MAG: GNAT family N-acetyltransferase [Saprospiraceae bacterium]|nr:GNAT family N-acetyltransferase [Saprospiraceae bacterium]
MSTIVTAIDPTDKAGLKRFISLERKLMKGQPKYISEIDDDVSKFLSGKSLMSKGMDIGLFVVSTDGVDVGRCAAIINKKFITVKQPGTGFIGYFAAAKGAENEVAALMESAEAWLKGKGMTKIIAPANGGAPNSMGFLVAGFDEDPMFPFPWSPAYYPPYLEQLAYEPTYPLWYYEVDLSNDKYKAAKSKYASFDGAVIRPFSKKNWNKDVTILADMLNTTFINEWEFAPASHEEMIEFFGPMKMILAPEQIQLAEVDGKPVGFCFAVPDLTPLFRSFNGSVGLTAIFKLLTRASKFNRAGILGIGVLDEYKGKGLAKALALKVYAYHESLGLKKSLYLPVNESNVDSRGFAESLGGVGRRMYQVYDKVIS